MKYTFKDGENVFPDYDDIVVHYDSYNYVFASDVAARNFIRKFAAQHTMVKDFNIDNCVCSNGYNLNTHTIGLL